LFGGIIGEIGLLITEHFFLGGEDLKEAID